MVPHGHAGMRIYKNAVVEQLPTPVKPPKPPKSPQPPPSPNTPEVPEVMKAPAAMFDID